MSIPEIINMLLRADKSRKDRRDKLEYLYGESMNRVLDSLEKLRTQADEERHFNQRLIEELRPLIEHKE
jgi:hypothetical protein